LKSELEKATIALQSKEQEHANYLKEVKDKCSSRDLRITELTALNTSMEEQQTEARTLIASLNTQITSIEAKLNHSNMNAQNLS
jgi:chromosome segregation ATPase